MVWRMSSEYYVFQNGGKDNAARRALFGTFIGLVAPEFSEGEEATKNIDFEQDRHFAGFRKSAGIWYRADKHDTCWDRRLVLWMRARSGCFLPFYDTENRLVTFDGKPLTEAAVCTLEVVLRNTASYSIGFLLLPKYKRRQTECISKASSWMVVGYFPFPAGPAGSIKRIDNCELDQDKIISLLLANSPQRNESSSRVSPRDGDFKPSSVNVCKRTSNNPTFESLKKRRIVNLSSVSHKEEKTIKTDYLEEPCKCLEPCVPQSLAKEPISCETQSLMCDQAPYSPVSFGSSSFEESMKDEKEFDSFVPWNYESFFYPSVACSEPSPSELGMKDEKVEDDYCLSDPSMFFFGSDSVNPMDVLESVPPAATPTLSMELFPRTNSSGCFDFVYPSSAFDFKKDE